MVQWPVFVKPPIISLGCSFLGFDGVEALRKPNHCMINDHAMNVLYSPTITRGPTGVKTIGEGECQCQTRNFSFRDRGKGAIFLMHLFPNSLKGDTLEFDCASEGNPSPKSSFLINGDQVTLERRVKAVRTLRNITCIAKNQIGSDSSTQVQIHSHLQF